LPVPCDRELDKFITGFGIVDYVCEKRGFMGIIGGLNAGLNF